MGLRLFLKKNPCYDPMACPRGSPHFSSKAVHEFVVVFCFHFNFHSRSAADPIMRALVSRDNVSTLMTRLVTSEKRSLLYVVNNVEYGHMKGQFGRH